MLTLSCLKLSQAPQPITDKIQTFQLRLQDLFGQDLAVSSSAFPPIVPFTLLLPFCSFIVWLETVKHTGHRVFALAFPTTWTPPPLDPLLSLEVPKVWSLNPPAAMSLGDLLEMKILSPTSDLVSQKLWGSLGHQARCFQPVLQVILTHTYVWEPLA